jgi:hypothetical protein
VARPSKVKQFAQASPVPSQARDNGRTLTPLWRGNLSLVTTRTNRSNVADGSDSADNRRVPCLHSGKPTRLRKSSNKARCLSFRYLRNICLTWEARRSGYAARIRTRISAASAERPCKPATSNRANKPERLVGSSAKRRFAQTSLSSCFPDMKQTTM